jgi:RimJ/RimL family protein N-acetyltransferase
VPCSGTRKNPSSKSRRSATSFTVRLAQEEDLGGSVALFDAVAAERRYLATESPVDLAERRERFLELIHAGARHWVADTDGGIVGILVTERRPSGPVSLGMAVAREWRRRGVGTALLEACVQWARESGVHKLSLEVFAHNDAAIALYRRLGFAEEGRLRKHYERADGELWDVIVMAWCSELRGIEAARAPRRDRK